MKYCNRCKLGIDTAKERYIIIEDKEGTKQLNKLYFHKNCWHELMTGKIKNKQLQDKAMNILNFASKRIGYGEEVVI